MVSIRGDQLVVVAPSGESLRFDPLTRVVQPAAQSAPEPPGSARCPSPVPATVGVGTGLPQTAPAPGPLTPVRHGTAPRELVALLALAPREPVW